MKKKKRSGTVTPVKMKPPPEAKRELLELSHAAVPGYKSAFYIALFLGTLYLGAIFILS